MGGMRRDGREEAWEGREGGGVGGMGGMRSMSGMRHGMDEERDER